jgi:hypothetical protein
MSNEKSNPKIPVDEVGSYIGPIVLGDYHAKGTTPEMEVIMRLSKAYEHPGSIDPGHLAAINVAQNERDPSTGWTIEQAKTFTEANKKK